MGTGYGLVVLLLSAAAVSAADIPKATTSGSKRECQWVSDCQTCTRPADGGLICSNIGIACQPKKFRCEPLVR